MKLFSPSYNTYRRLPSSSETQGQTVGSGRNPTCEERGANEKFTRIRTREMIATITTEKLSDPYDYRFPYIATIVEIELSSISATTSAKIAGE